MKKTRRNILLCLALAVLTLCAAFSACGGKDTAEFTFDTMGGDPIESVTVDIGSEYTLPIPTWEKHGFEGWYASRDLDGEKIVSVVAEKDATFYAKWSELSEITLDLGEGGALEGAAGKLYLKAGEDLFAFMEGYRPTREGFEFDCWYLGGAALSRNAKMPAEGVTLTAHYRVGYTVQTYLQNLSQDGFDRGEDIHGFAQAGESFTPVPDVHGFRVTENENELTTLVLGEDPSQNVFRFYFERREFSLVLFSNYPQATGLEERTETYSVLYGGKIELPEEIFAIRGYYLTGWATSNEGERVYECGYLSNRLFGGEKTEPVEVTVEDNAVLYAVWNRGYTDLFGGSDYIYVAGDAAYLERGELFFEGSYDERGNSVIFRGEGGTVLLEGVLHPEDGTYTYYDPDRAGYATLYIFGTGIDESTRIVFDEFNKITYSVQAEDGTSSQSEGSYRLDDSGYYVAEFTTGPMTGETLTFAVESMNVDGVTRSLFQVRNEEDLALGTLVRFAVVNGQIASYTSAYFLTLNGMAVAGLYTTDMEYYYYLRDDDVIRLYDSELNLAYTYKLMTFGDVMGYMPYNSSYDVTFEGEDGASLTLDGTCHATYRAGGVTEEGYYMVGATAFDGTAVRSSLVGFVNGNTVRNFLVSFSSEQIGGAIIPRYNFTERHAEYGEYYYKNDEADTYFYYSPLIVLNETKKDELVVYALNQAGDYVKIAAGSYIADEESGLYLGTLTEHIAAEVRETPIDLTNVSTFVFDISTLSIRGSYYGVAYIYSTTAGEDTTRFDTVYEEEDGNGTLTLVATFAVYKSDEGEFTGIYTENGDVLTVSTSYDGAVYSLSFELDRENNKFIRLRGLLGTATALLADGTENRGETLTFDGKNGAVYSVTEGEETVTHEGTFTDTEEATFAGYRIYEFDGDGIKFRFIVVSAAQSAFFARYNKDCNGVYTNDAGSLEVDGFGVMATYTVNNVLHRGVYFLSEDGAVCFLDAETEREYYFDLKEGRTFTVRGAEYGTYLLFDNQYFGGVYLTLDGYGMLTAFTYADGEEGERTVLGQGTYTLNDDGTYFMTYSTNDGPWVCIGALGTVTRYSADTQTNELLPAVFPLHEEIAGTYVNEEDLTVILLDGYGQAIKYNAMGVAERGTYIRITDTMLYYANAAGTDACIYEYDSATGLAYSLSFERFSYYTEDLESLLFTNYGFMIMGGTTRYYYHYVGEDIYVYHLAQDGETGNAYGYVEERFGKVENQKTWKEKTYYLNNGYALMFKRAEEGKEKYPVSTRNADNTVEKCALEDLTFTPSGSAEFSVNGTVTINGQNFACVVTRSLLDDGTPEMTLAVQNFRFGINISYRGENDDGSTQNFYEVTSMKYQLVVQSWMYMYLSYILAMNGMSVNNTYGAIVLNETYDESGEAVEGTSLATARFGGNSGVRDTNGELIAVDDAPYTISENGRYCIEFEGEDGYKYRVYFELANDFYRIFGYYGYHLYAFTRVETLDVGEDRLEVERVIATESTQMNVGGLFSVNFYRGEELLTAELAFSRENTIYYAVKDGETENLFTYYIFTLVEDIPSDLGDEEEHSGVYTYLSASLTEKKAQRYASSDNTFADFDVESDEVIAVVLTGSIYLAQSTERNDDGSYTVTSASGRKFLVEKDGTISMIEEEEAE